MQGWKNHIKIKPEAMYGKQVIKGMHIPVDLILEKLSNEQSCQDILKDYPDLRKKYILAFHAYATSFVRNEISCP